MSHKKIIIAYFSKKGRNYVDGQIIDLPIGNTQVVATIIQDITHGELFQIEPVSPYPDDYTQATDVARDELRGGARPPLARLVSDIADYAVVFLGYPNWWNTMPMPVFTFLEKHDLSLPDEISIIALILHARRDRPWKQRKGHC